MWYGVPFACQRRPVVGVLRGLTPPLLRWCTALVRLPWGRRQPPPPSPEAARVEDLHSVLFGGGGGVLTVKRPVLRALTPVRVWDGQWTAVVRHFNGREEHCFLGGGGWHGRPFAPPPLRMTFRLVVVPLRGPGQSPVRPFACCVGSLLSVGRCGRCSCWCRFRIRGAPSLVYRGCAGCGGMCRLCVSGAR